MPRGKPVGSRSTGPMQYWFLLINYHSSLDEEWHPAEMSPECLVSRPLVRRYTSELNQLRSLGVNRHLWPGYSPRSSSFNGAKSRASYLDSDNVKTQLINANKLRLNHPKFWNSFRGALNVWWSLFLKRNKYPNAPFERYWLFDIAARIESGAITRGELRAFSKAVDAVERGESFEAKVDAIINAPRVESSGKTIAIYRFEGYRLQD